MDETHELVLRHTPQIALSLSISRTSVSAGVSNELALRHIPQVAPRNDSQAGPAGRRGDQVGGWLTPGVS